MPYKKLIFYFFCLIFISCSNNKNPYANTLGIQPSVVAQIDTAHYTLIQWQDSIFNFGTLKVNDSVHLKYSFKNVGATPLFITEARPSCGCTVTNFPKDPIMPGKSGVITATMQSGFHTGEINKTIVVKSNTKDHVNSILIIRGTILPADKK
ncbi:MAG: DUF1573 domain-containing protein [Parafilimonas sp.]